MFPLSLYEYMTSIINLVGKSTKLQRNGNYIEINFW